MAEDPQPADQDRFSTLMDRFGATASSLCAVHCALCALLPAAFGALGLGFLFGHEVEWGLTLVAVLFAVVALVLGWRRHRSVLAAVLLSLGIAGLLGSRALEAASPHDDHHGGEHGEHHEEEHKDEHKGEHKDEHKGEERAEHHEAEAEHEEGALHGIGAGLGIVAGLLLVVGHVVNLRETRRCQDDCQDDCA